MLSVSISCFVHSQSSASQPHGPEFVPHANLCGVCGGKSGYGAYFMAIPTAMLSDVKSTNVFEGIHLELIIFGRFSGSRGHQVVWSRSSRNVL